MDHDDPTPSDPVAARIHEELRTRSIGAELNAAGISTVSLDDEGRTVVHRPDGTSYLLQHEQDESAEPEPGGDEAPNG